MNLTLNTISNWEKFEDLVAEYFRVVKSQDNNIIEVKVEPTGNGPDGGRDILVTFKVNDSIESFQRKWIVQCKFYKGMLKEKDLATINIPGKIHQYGANGFLLVVKDRVQANVTKMFEDFRANCKFSYNYEIWNGSQFISKIIGKDPILKQYFPKYHAYTKQQQVKKLKNIIK